MEQVKAEPVAMVRVTHSGFGMELATHIAYALPEGDHWLYATPQPAAVDGLVEKLTKRAFVMKEPHLSGHRICIGFEHEQDSWEAFNGLVQALAQIERKPEDGK